jgi:subtilase family serine protease
VLSSRRFLAALSTLLACGCALIPAVAAAETVPVGEAPTLPEGATLEGPVAPQRPLDLYVALEPRDPAALHAYAEEVATPGSPVFGQYLSVPAFAERFGPTAAEVATVRRALEAEGLDVGATPANHLSLPVEATAAEAEAAFDTGIRRIETAAGEAGYISTDAPQVAEVAAPYVSGVIGLDDLARPHRAGAAAAESDGNPLSLGTDAVPNATADPPAATTSGPQPCSEASAAATTTTGRFGYTAEKFAAAYGLDKFYAAGNLGAGQTIALYEQEPFKASDIETFQHCYGTHTEIETVEVGSGIEPKQKEQGEANLDVEQVVQLAPEAHVIVYRAADEPSGEAAILSKWVTENRAKVMSSSYGWCEKEYPLGNAGMAATDTLLQEAAVQGQTFLVASGDYGSTDCETEETKDTSIVVDFPGADPFSTDVGGTRLENPTAAQPIEYLWNEYPVWGAGGGGISAHFPMPDYQLDAASDLHVIGALSSGKPCGFAGYCREVPDVSAAASAQTGYIVYFQGYWEVTGGTSAAAPLWASLAALTNASPACDGHSIGFLNPALYSIAGSDYAGNFRDITGAKPGGRPTTNRLDPTQPYPAGPGYDMATGIGAPLGDHLGASLCALANPVPPTPPTPPSPPEPPAPPAPEPTPSDSTTTPTPTKASPAPAPISAPATPAHVANSSLAGIADGAPKLSLGIEARSGAKLETVKIALPKGLTAGTKKQLAAGIVATAGGKRVKVAVSKSGTSIQVRLLSPASGITLKITAPALTVNPTLRKRIQKKQTKTVHLQITTTESGGTTTRLPLNLPL